MAMRVEVVSVLVGAIAVGAGYGAGIPLVFPALLWAIFATTGVLIRRSVKFLRDGQQLRVEQLTEKVVYNGPGVFVLNPLSYSSAEIVSAESLGTMDYIKVRDVITGREFVERGPQLVFLKANEEVAEAGRGVTLTETEYLVVSDELTGARKLVKGPCAWFPAAHEVPTPRETAIAPQAKWHRAVSKLVKGPRAWSPAAHEVSTPRETAIAPQAKWHRIVGKLVKGSRAWSPAAHEVSTQKETAIAPQAKWHRIVGKLVKGPRAWSPAAHEVSTQKETAIALQEDEFIRVGDEATGGTVVKRGKDLVFLEPTWRVVGGVQKCWTLKTYEYVRLLDNITGKVTVHRGEATIFPSPTEQPLDGDKLSATELKANEYVKIMDKATGGVRVVAGPNLVFLGAYDEFMGKKKPAAEVDDEHAVLVRDTSTGQQRLVTEKQLFFPGANDSIMEIRPLIRLSDHEAVIIKDGDGNLTFHYGDPKRQSGGKAKSFFLPPYAELVELQWSAGLRRAKRNLVISRFDCRPQFMWNEIDCRTQDNVELVLETTILWEVMDLAKMVRSTGNLPGDVYNQLRAQFIKHVARCNLKGFMESLHAISGAIFDEGSSFYEKRGVKIHSLEVTKYQCAEQRTSEVLQQIIEETTNRLNRLSQAESENEVRLFSMQGQIEQEKLNGELLTIQHEHAKSEAAVSGTAEAERVAAFLESLKEQAPDLSERVQMWQVLRKTDSLSVISQGGASLYYTPNDVDLSIKCEGK